MWSDCPVLLYFRLTLAENNNYMIHEIYHSLPSHTLEVI